MAPNGKQVRGLDSLDKEIHRLEQKAKRLEQNIDDNFTYFQHHSGSLFVNSLFPRKTEEEMHAEGFSLGGNILYTLLQNERLRKSLGKLGSRLAERLGDGLNRLIDILLRERKD